MSLYIKRGNTYRCTSKEQMDLHEVLPPGNFIIKQDQYEEFFLEEVDPFSIGSRVYGDVEKTRDRILNTFLGRNCNTGVMLTGEKGSGKTMLSKMISIKAAEAGIPTFIVNTPWCGDQFNAFVQAIEQPCIFLFDEFEKVYNQDRQKAILTLLDGAFPTKHLYIITCNDKWGVDIMMRNRPGRMYYMMDFSGLSSEFIKEYCEERLHNQEHIERLCKIASVFQSFNFDMLKALVEEMNRYGETPEASLEFLNINPEFEDTNHFDVVLNVNGQDIPENELYNNAKWRGNPLQHEVSIEYRKWEAPDADGNRDWEWASTKFTPSDLVDLASNGRSFVFRNNGGIKVTLTRTEKKHSRYFDVI